MIPISNIFPALPSLSDTSQDSERFLSVLAHTLFLEGGAQAHPLDRGNSTGGSTNHGITQKAYDSFRTKRGLSSQSNLLISPLEVATLYYEDYWIPSGAGQLPNSLQLLHFDAAVHHGVPRASRLLQQTVGAVQDGIVGPRTLSKAWSSASSTLSQRYLTLRTKLFENLAANDPSQRVFLKGWKNRLLQLRRFVQ